VKPKKNIYNYGIDVDSKTLEQFEDCYSKEFVVSAALMPDAHVGYAAPIGAVLKTHNFVVPAWVGFDIGCGLIAIKIKGKNLIEKIKNNKEKIYKKVIKKIPMGVGEYNKEKNVTEKTKKEFKKLLEKFQKKTHNKGILNYLKTGAIKHLGTLGAGNHFIEIGYDSKTEKELWLIIHSGSRGVGHSVAKKYMIKASKSFTSSDVSRQNLGKSKEKSEYEKTFPLEANSEIGKEYLNVLEFGLDYALLNRLEMAYKVVEAINEILSEDLKYELWVNKNHNHAIYEKGYFIHRKGATPAKKGERGIIPGNMRDGSFLVEGKGNSKFLNSSSHGAGRVMSRKEARKKYTMHQFAESMKEVKGNISEKTLDEIPMAYKDIFRIMESQKDSVKFVKHIKPIINWKG
jgi:tRNA-splicing ligase RtcB|tara:strand:+ start:5290 stop:6492 length:1203 start_codon:yes stop_codon:yes gene_type:complete